MHTTRDDDEGERYPLRFRLRGPRAGAPEPSRCSAPPGAMPTLHESARWQLLCTVASWLGATDLVQRRLRVRRGSTSGRVESDLFVSAVRVVGAVRGPRPLVEVDDELVDVARELGIRLELQLLFAEVVVCLRLLI
jgi:hypothetical protein